MSQQNDNAKARKSEQRGTKAESKRRVSYGTSGPADWGSVEPQSVLRAIEVVARKGGALRLGYTRDGGAYAIGIMGDGEPYTEYLRPSDDVGEYLRVLAEQWDD